MPARILPHLSNPRLAVYRAECGDPTDANVAALYAWQGELHAAWYEVLGYVEMMLRHSLDNALADWNVSSTFPGGGSREWLTNAAKPLDSLKTKMAEDAKSCANRAAAQRAPTHPRSGALVTHDDLVAQLTFGNLTSLLLTKSTQLTHRKAKKTGRSGRENLWLNATINAFPHIDTEWPPGVRGNTNDRKIDVGYYVGNTAENLRRLRNRVGHHEQTLNANHAARHDEALALARAIDPDAGAAITSLSSVPKVLAERPKS